MSDEEKKTSDRRWLLTTAVCVLLGIIGTQFANQVAAYAAFFSLTPAIEKHMDDDGRHESPEKKTERIDREIANQLQPIRVMLEAMQMDIAEIKQEMRGRP